MTRIMSMVGMLGGGDEDDAGAGGAGDAETLL